MSNHSFAIRDKHHGQAATPKGTSTRTGVFAGKPERATIDGKVKFRSWESIIILERLIPNGTLQLFMVSHNDEEG
jgi:hypothetical protein